MWCLLKSLFLSRIYLPSMQFYLLLFFYRSILQIGLSVCNKRDVSTTESRGNSHVANLILLLSFEHSSANTNCQQPVTFMLTHYICTSVTTCSFLHAQPVEIYAIDAILVVFPNTRQPQSIYSSFLILSSHTS